MHLAEEQKSPVGLAKTLGVGEIIFMGIGSLIGGGIFSLLGPAAGMAGPALCLAMVLGAGVAFLNLQMYLALGTTFPEAGGGYLWVRRGLGNFQGFLAGWLSWFAHAAACGVYALTFGYYFESVLRLMGVPLPETLFVHTDKLIAFAVVVLFGYLNWRGAKSTGRAGNWLTAGLLLILGLFIGSGLFRMFGHPQPLAPFAPFLPNGIFGILAATSFFYIAFEGSEIQVQAGEETKDPAKTLKTALIASWAVVTAIYLLVSVVVIGATSSAGMPSWQFLGGFSEGAIVAAAKTFMPLGGLLMTLAGLLANLAALNSTIFSSSHVSFALARDKNIWSGISRIHARNFTPHVAVIFSTALIAGMVLFLPLFDVASAASLLFVLLFLQLNLAGINLHFKHPDIKWVYKVPFFPLPPLLATAIYVLLALAMLRINAMAWAITVVWALVGLVNYFSYAARKGREDFEEKIVFEEAVRIGPKTGRRLILPIAPRQSLDQLKPLVDVAVALASRMKGDLIFLKVHEVPPPLALLDDAIMEQDKKVFASIKQWVEDFNAATPGKDNDVSYHNLVLIGRDVTDTILEAVRMEDGDLLIMNWEGYTMSKRVIFGSKIDRILREAQCDLLVVRNPGPVRTIALAANPKAKNPHLELIGEIYRAMREHHQARGEMVCVLGREVPVYFKTDAAPVIRGLGLTPADFDEVRWVNGRSIANTLITETKGRDLVIVGAAKPKFLKDIRFGGIPESLAKHSDAPLFIVKGHIGMAEAMFSRVQALFRLGKR